MPAVAIANRGKRMGSCDRTRHYSKDGSLVIDTYEGRWRDEQTGEGGTAFTLLVRLLGSWGSARRWLRRNGYMHALGPGPRREPGGNRERGQKGLCRSPQGTSWRSAAI